MVPNCEAQHLRADCDSQPRTKSDIENKRYETFHGGRSPAVIRTILKSGQSDGTLTTETRNPHTPVDPSILITQDRLDNGIRYWEETVAAGDAFKDHRVPLVDTLRPS